MTLNGTWTNAAGSTITATGATLNLGNRSSQCLEQRRHDQRHQLHGEPGRPVHPGWLGHVQPHGGTVNLTGTLDNTGTTLALDATTGSWNLVGGTLKAAR